MLDIMIPTQYMVEGCKDTCIAWNTPAQVWAVWLSQVHVLDTNGNIGVASCAGLRKDQGFESEDEAYEAFKVYQGKQ